MIKYGICLTIGFILGMITMYSFDYYRNMKEFSKRQEQYKKMM